MGRKSKTRSSPPKALICVGLLMVAAGAIVTFFFGAPLLWIAHQSSSWPTTEGVITESGIESNNASGRRRSRFHRKRAKEHQAYVVYSFSVDGTQYEGSDILYGKARTRSREKQEAIVALYPVGRNIDVYFDPNDPTRSVLQPGINVETWGILLACIVVIGVGAWMRWEGKRKLADL